LLQHEQKPNGFDTCHQADDQEKKPYDTRGVHGLIDIFADTLLTPNRTLSFTPKTTKPILISGV
jgi:hypothetical protein